MAGITMQENLLQNSFISAALALVWGCISFYWGTDGEYVKHTETFPGG